MSICRENGIICPIIPGLLPIQNYLSFYKIIHLTKVNVPLDLMSDIDSIRKDDDKIKLFGVNHAVSLAKEHMLNGACGVHFYTLNLEKSICEIVTSLGINGSKEQQAYPWKKASSKKREDEKVRPIFWQNNCKSYLARTLYWDEYPNGIWGDSRSPAFGELTDNLYSMCKNLGKDKVKRYKQLRQIWGESIESLNDVSAVFISFLNGKIGKLPFSEEEFEKETIAIKDLLIELNENYLFTINSQPAVNGAKSSDSVYGWGPENGRVYQKFYVEVFISKENLELLMEILSKYEMIYYMAKNRQGDMLTSNTISIVNALTWGIFPGKEISQPTIYDSEVFDIWKEEAFKGWKTWADIYSLDEDRKENSILNQIYDEYYLITIVDDDFIDSKGETALRDFLIKLKNNKKQCLH